MEADYLQLVEQQLAYRPDQIKHVLKLVEEGNTIPFIARYRKEATGSLDEVQLREITATYQQVEKLEKRRADIKAKIAEQKKLTPKLEQMLVQAQTLQQLEDIYLPFKQKRQTKAQIARQRGLEGLAKFLLTDSSADVISEAQKYVDPKKEINTPQEALAGAHEILAEAFGENASLRAWVRKHAQTKGKLVAKVKDESLDEKGIYQDYYTFEEGLKTILDHRILALDRGEKEKILQVKIQLDDEYVLRYFHARIIGQKLGPSMQYVEQAYTDAYRRFIQPAIERELRKELTARAAASAIAVFGDNLYHLLMQAPLKGKTVLGLDPAFRTGCKLAVVDPTGKFLAKAVIYPHEKAKGKRPDPKKRAQAKQILLELLEKYQVEMIAIGNGTASRESESFVAEVLSELKHKAYYVIVNEAGASVYSASAQAREEFPDFNVEERSAVSIARRLQDPLAELIKIDPKAIGVGQYQHDLPEKQLDEELQTVIETGVNQAGVNLNTASAALLQHISGLNKTTAKNIVAYRDENGRFTTRTQLKKVARLGQKAYEQAAGFLRIIGGKNVFDNTDIHPESYPLAKAILAQAQIEQAEIGTALAGEKLVHFDAKAFAKANQAGLATVKDIVASLKKPGRTLRDSMPAPLLKADVLHLEDLKVGMKLQGTVRNVVDFGAFVDIGVKQDGLVHVSKMSQRFIKHPSQVVAVGDIVDVYVTDVDLKRGRIQLSMLAPTDD
ncbi:Tex family protein [Ligilactobacillus animalis]|uniref:Tex family protein n=1 Tax=Ligilactobacillus animalis TaxID=1605 RepID=UPI00266BB338|nr:Tex family protein [Ligilactobacillus animalis]